MNDGLFRLVADSATDLIHVFDRDGHVVYASPSAVKFFGRAPGVRFEEVHPDDLERCHAWWERLVAGERERTSYRIRRADGTWRWFESWGSRVLHEGAPHVISYCRDVTEHMVTVEALRASERQLVEAGRIAHVGHWEYDVASQLSTWSEETWRIVGLEPSEQLPTGGRWTERIHPDDRALQKAAIERAARGEARYDLVYRVVRADGDVRTVHSVGHVVRDAAGRAERMFGIVQDITDRKKREEEVALFRSLIDHAHDAFEVIDAETGRFLDVNERACAAHGYTREEYLELCVSDIDPIVGQKPWPEVRDLARALGACTVESQHRRKDGTVFPVEVNCTIVRRDREYLLAVVRDISDRKRAEQELQRAEDQLRHAQKLEAVGRLAGGVAHDFNNLLTVINGDAELVLEDLPPDHRMREIVEEIREAGQRGATLTQQLLAFSRKQVLAPRVVGVDAFLGGLRNILRRVIGEDIDVRFVQGAAGASVKMDPGRFEQAVLNLAVNARDSMPRGGTLTIETAREGDDLVVVRVSDSGHGIDETTRARIFEPFFTTKEPGRGTGLGLAMVQGFVEQSGGRIEVESEAGCGTTFVIRLPRATGPSEEDARPVSEVPASGTETILLVEDEDNVRTMSKRVLQAQGYTVLDARDGADAVSLARCFEAPIDILVTDVVLPRMGGRDVAEVLGRERPEMRVLLMSGYSDPVVTVEGNTAFLQKPFRPKDLARKVRAVLDGALPAE